MTKRECAIVTAFTGVNMMSGENMNVFYSYVQEIMGRPIFTHELALWTVQDEIKERSRPDFEELCRTATEV